MDDLVERLTVKDAYDLGVPLDEISLRCARFLPLQPRINEIQVAVNHAILEALVPVATRLRQRETDWQEAGKTVEQFLDRATPQDGVYIAFDAVRRLAQLENTDADHG